VDLFLQTLVNGLIQSGTYALASAGLALAVGVLHIVNFAHGEFLMVGAFVAFWLSVLAGIDPLVSLVPAGALLFAASGLTYQVSLRHVLGGPELNPLLLTFGIAITLQNLAVLAFGATPRVVHTPYQLTSLHLGPVTVGVAPLLTLIVSVAILSGMYTVLFRTGVGKSIRAVAQNRTGAALVGLDVDRIYLLTFGLASALAAVAGAMVLVRVGASPHMGFAFVLKAFAIIVMAGLGNLTGVLWASLVLATGEALVRTYMPGGGGWSEAVFFLLIFGTLVWRSWRGG
jgi:branched-chain amino acid transport system permease protein